MRSLRLENRNLKSDKMMLADQCMALEKFYNNMLQDMRRHLSTFEAELAECQAPVQAQLAHEQALRADHHDGWAKSQSQLERAQAQVADLTQQVTHLQQQVKNLLVLVEQPQEEGMMPEVLSLVDSWVAPSDPE
eukprot:jgi/Botrbrau1/8200/Bobra.357_2s0039.1